MKIHRSNISKTNDGEMAEARVELPYPMQADDGSTVIYGHGESKLAATRDLLKRLRLDFPEIDIAA